MIRPINVRSLVWLLSIVCVLAQGGGYVQGQATPDSAATMYDVVTWDPQAMNKRALREHWLFYRNQFITRPEEAGAPGQRLTLNGEGWETYASDGQAQGYATYIAQLRMPKGVPQLAMQVPFIWTSYRVYVNGSLVAQSGVPANSSEGYAPKMVKRIVPLPQDVQMITIAIQVADYSFPFSGMLDAPVAGLQSVLISEREAADTLSAALIGALFIIFVYFILFYLFRKQEKAIFYFSLISLAVAIRFSVFGDNYIYQWWNDSSGFFSFTVQVKLYYLITFWLANLGLRFLKALFPDEVNNRIKTITRYVLIAYTAVAMVLPLDIFMQTVNVGTGIMIAMFAYIVYIIAVASVRKRPYARLLATGLLIMAFTGLSDFLQLQGIYLLGTGESLTYGFLGFLFTQFLAVSNRFTTAFNDLEDLSEHLEQKVEQRTEELRVANAEIQEKNKDITDSIEYARRIQLSILPDSEMLFRFMPDSMLLYMPKDIVSGDYYWLHENGPYLYVCCADCTGHGVPGAFMSVLGNNLLNQIVRNERHPTPSRILELLNDGVRAALKQDEKRADGSQDGMDVALVRFDMQNRTALFAGANRPLVRLSQGELHEMTPTKMPIGGSQYDQEETRFQEFSVPMEPGDVLFMFTDGATDQFGGENHRKFTGKRFRSLLQELANHPMQDARKRIEQELREWMSNTPQTDDILVMGLRIPG